MCFHGYTSEGLNDYTSIAKFYLNQGFNLMVVDERAHGKSEGTYIGFGCLDAMTPCSGWSMWWSGWERTVS